MLSRNQSWADFSSFQHIFADVAMCIVFDSNAWRKQQQKKELCINFINGRIWHYVGNLANACLYTI